MPRKMSNEHKAALAKGRQQGRAVRRYLEALNEGGKPGRRLDEPTLKKRIAEVQDQIGTEQNAAKRVELIQKRLDYEKRLDLIGDTPDLEELEREFVEAAKEYSERKGITYSAWREAGVPAAVLRDAGIPRTRRTA